MGVGGWGGCSLHFLAASQGGISREAENFFAPSLNLSVPAGAAERVSTTTTALAQKQRTNAGHMTSARLRSSGTDGTHRSTHARSLFSQCSYYLIDWGWLYDDACQRACLFPPLITVMIGSDAALAARKAALCGRAAQRFQTAVDAAVMKRL